ncbi:MAG: Tetratricopeptide 4 [Myxococcales bacterium]|nr:Tetratricopeptide 4 [Myxococcales bacterium]
MAKKRGEADPLDRVFDGLEEAAPGVHDLAEPADMLPTGLPAALIELYARCDGGRIFVDTLELLPSEDVRFDGVRWQFANLEGETISIDVRGKVWRKDESVDDEVCDGTRLDRWLAGQIDAIALLFDPDGEYADDVFDEDGEILDIVREKQLRAQLKRDAAAPGPRWRLALALAEQGATEDARNELEQVVADDPAFAWAWLDLARISEKLGEIGGALDESRMAAEAAEGLRHPQAGYFWAQVARFATRVGDEMVRAEAATKASLLAPELKRAQIEGARERIESGDTASAKGLLELLRAVWPRDLEVLELARRIEAPPPT